MAALPGQQYLETLQANAHVLQGGGGQEQAGRNRQAGAHVRRQEQAGRSPCEEVGTGRQEPT